MKNNMDFKFWTKFCTIKKDVIEKLGYCSQKEHNIEDLILCVCHKKNVRNISENKKEVLLNVFMNEFIFECTVVDDIITEIINKYENKYKLVEIIVLSQILYEFHYGGEYNNIKTMLDKLDIINNMFQNNTLLDNYCLIIKKEEK